MNAKKRQLLDDLAQAIRTEDARGHFGMAFFVAPDTPGLREHYDAPGRRPLPLPSCDTARCIAGHLLAIRPGLAQALREPYDDYTGLAARVYRAETGESSCPLDFFGDNSPKPLYHITADEAIAHLYGESEDWPLLGNPDVYADDE